MTDALEDEIRRGRLAKEVLENEEFIRAFNTVRDSLINKIEELNFDEEITRDKVMLSLQLLRGLKDELSKTLSGGMLAAETVDRMTRTKNG